MNFDGPRMLTTVMVPRYTTLERKKMKERREKVWGARGF